jgi:two-component system response regulator NreC
MGPLPPEVSRCAQPITVVLADDHPSMRQTLRLLLESEGGFEVVAEARDLPSTREKLDRHRPQVLVLDFGLIEDRRLETVRRLRLHAPSVQIVLLTMDDNRLFSRRALESGALGFVLKELADTDLPAAVYAAAQGTPYVTPRLAAGQESMWRLSTRTS